MTGVAIFVLYGLTVVLATTSAPLFVILVPAIVGTIVLLALWSRSRWWPSEVLDRLENRR